MPITIIKKVYDYCTYNKKYFAFIFVLLLISSAIREYFYNNYDNVTLIFIRILTSIIVFGYGMCITRDRINEGIRLPKIVIKDILYLGIKCSIVYSVYIIVQGFILDIACRPLDFPPFNLEEMLLELPETLNMLYGHDPTNTIIFIIVGSILFYISAFFMEIGLARLADSRSILSAFNILAIKRNIDDFGWRNYIKDYTLIIVTIVILTYIQSINFPHSTINYLIEMILSIMIFATQYLGIGAVYCDIKKKNMVANK